MADIGHAHRVLAIKIGLEREQAQNQIAAFGDAAYAALPPGPDGRTDVVHGLDATLAQSPLQPQIEIRRVDADHAAGAVVAEALHQFRPQAKQARQLLDHFGQAHHRQRVDGLDGLTTGGDHARTGHAIELCLRIDATQGSDQGGAEDITGGFAGNQSKFHA